MNAKILKGYLFAIVSAVIYGCMPLMATHIYADGVNPMTLVFLRNCLALPVLAILAVSQQKTLKIPAKSLLSTIVLSFFGCFITPILLFSSYQHMASGTATIFHFAYPAIVVIAGILFLKKKAQVLNIVSVLLCVIGISLFYNPSEPISFTGAAFALGSAITFAAYVVLLSQSKKEISGFLFTFYIALFASIMTFIACVTTNNLALPESMKGWGLCLLFAISVTVGAVVLFQQATFMIGGEKTSILSTLEPITSVVIGILILKEQTNPTVYIGSALVVTASLLIAVADMKKTKS